MIHNLGIETLSLSLFKPPYLNLIILWDLFSYIYLLHHAFSLPPIHPKKVRLFAGYTKKRGAGDRDRKVYIASLTDPWSSLELWRVRFQRPKSGESSMKLNWNFHKVPREGIQPHLPSFQTKPSTRGVWIVFFWNTTLFVTPITSISDVSLTRDEKSIRWEGRFLCKP